MLEYSHSLLLVAVKTGKVCGVCIGPRQSSRCFMLQLLHLIRL